MRIHILAFFISVGVAAQVFAAETTQAVEDDLDAIVPQKNGEPGKPQPQRDATKASVLDPIVLKENPTQADVALYLKELIKALKDDRLEMKERAVRDRAMMENLNPGLSQKLDAIPSAYIGEILKADEGNPSPILTYRFAVVTSINKRTDLDESHKEAVLKYLPDYPGLIGTVTKHGWEKGAEATIIKTIKQMGVSSTTPFVPVLAAYGTPASNKILIELLTTKRPEEIAQNIAALMGMNVQDLDIEDVVVKAWKGLHNASSNQAAGLAPLAARYGCLDALLYMAKRLNGTPNNYDRGDIKIRMGFFNSLHQLVPDGGADEKSLIKYVLANRTKLTFDKGLKVYRLPKP